MNFNADEVQSQVTEEAEDNQSRPDLIIENGIGTIIMELKVDPYCNLTKTQPESYLYLFKGYGSSETVFRSDSVLSVILGLIMHAYNRQYIFQRSERK